MNPKQLHCFITAAQEGSFSKAAKKLYLSQQALSKTIDKLEEELDVVLFDRSGHRTFLICRCMTTSFLIFRG